MTLGLNVVSLKRAIASGLPDRSVIGDAPPPRARPSESPPTKVIEYSCAIASGVSGTNVATVLPSETRISPLTFVRLPLASTRSTMMPFLRLSAFIASEKVNEMIPDGSKLVMRAGPDVRIGGSVSSLSGPRSSG